MVEDRNLEVHDVTPCDPTEGVVVPGHAREVATRWHQRAASIIRKIAVGRLIGSPASANGKGRSASAEASGPDSGGMRAPATITGAPADLRARRSAGHVLVVIENAPIGIDCRALRQVDDLLASGYRVSAVTRRDPAGADHREQPGMRVLEYPPPRQPGSKLGYVNEYGASLGWAAVLSLSVRLRGRVDIVQFCEPPDIYFPLGWILRGLGVKVLVDQRDLMPELFAARYGQANPIMMSVLRWLERRTQHVAQHTLCSNETFRGRLIEAGARPERVTIIGNGPVLSRIQAATADRTLRGQHKFLCCWIGAMNPQDHVDLLIRIIAHIVRDLGRTDCGFAVIGDGECFEEARAQSARLGLEAWVDFPGWLPQDKVFSYLASADLGLDTSLQNEISPHKVIEYMASGLPFVAFDVRETRVLGEGASVLVPPADIESYARRVVALIDDVARRSEMGEVGRQRVRADLSWERQSIAYLDVIRRLGQRTPSARGSGRRAVSSGRLTARQNRLAKPQAAYRCSASK
jgi:glycosyltransferase involved in cell wall biosynthesis